MAIHFKYGGSTAARTIQCPAWARLSSELPARGESSNPAADEGTMLHNCMELIYGEGYEQDVTPASLIGHQAGEYKGQELTLELVETKLKPAIEAVEKLFDDYDMADWKVEPLVVLDDDMGGSIDLIGISLDGKTVVVADYKFGFHGVQVEHNKQGQFYVLAAATDPQTADWFENAERIVIAIIQPNNEGEDLQTWEIDMAQIDTFETEYLNAVDASEDPDALPVSGPGCTYCPAQATCPVKTGLAMKATRVNELTSDKLAEYLPLAKEVTDWAKAVEKMAHEQLELGTPIKGYKLVAKRTTRVWDNEKLVEDKVRKAKKIKLVDGFTTKLKSPAQIEKVCKALGLDFDATYGKMQSSVSSGTTMALESDKRSAIVPLAGLEQLNQMMGGE